MESNLDKLLNPNLLVDDAKSIISLLPNCYPEQQQSENVCKILKYPFGADYHYVIKAKIKKLLFSIQESIVEFACRAFVDSVRFLDKAWAAKSGLRYIGKNSNLLTQKVGSFYFIAELIIDFDLDYDCAKTDHCGSCTSCIDAFLAQAIVAPYVVDGSKCISYFSIE
jgi:epoxyqueuosine reductase